MRFPDELSPTWRRRQGSSLINLGSNELCHRELEQVHRRVLPQAGGFHRYPVQDIAAQAVAAAWDCSPQELVFAPGSDAAIRSLVAVLSARGAFARLIVTTPDYPAWRQASAFWRLSAVETVPPVSAAGDPYAEIRAAVRQGPPALVGLSWPSSPGGWCTTAGEIGELAAFCAAHGSLLIADACYAAFHAGIDPLGPLAQHAMIVMSGSKMFGLAGARVAIVRSSQALAAQLAESGLENCVSQFALDAFAACFSRRDEFEPLWRDISAAREAARDQLRRAGHHVPPSGGNFLHVTMTDAARAQDVAAALHAVGYRTKANMALPWWPSVRFTIAATDGFPAFLDRLDSALRKGGLHAA